MKKIIISTIILVFALSVNAQFTIDDNGKVGINKINPQYVLDVSGTIRYDTWTDVIMDNSHGTCCGQPAIYPENSWFLRLGTPDKKLGDIYATHIFCHWVSESSDEEFKENINKLERPLDKIMQINGVRYTFKPEVFEGLPEELQIEYSQKQQIGFIAQNVEEVYPELVEHDKETDDMAISYTRMIPILLEAIKEQQIQIESLQNDIANCCKSNDKTKSLMSKASGTSANEVDNDMKRNILYQNSPNPFFENTQIKYYLAKEAIDAALYLFDMQGTLLKTYKILDKGYGEVNVNGSDLNAGMYIYSLIVDDVEIDSKQMILR